MPYLEDSLSKDEQVVARFRLHWTAYLMLALWLLLGPLTFGVTWLAAVYEFLRLRGIEQGVTNKRVVLKRGIVSRRTEEMKLKSIETVEIDQGVLARVLGHGDVRVTGKGLSDVTYRRVADPMAVKRAIESISNPVD